MRGGFLDAHDVIHLRAFGIEAKIGRGGHLLLVADDGAYFRHRAVIIGTDLRRAAGDDDALIRMLAPGAADGLARLRLGLGRHRAGVENDGVAQARLQRVLFHHFAFIGIQTAAECNHIDGHGRIPSEIR